MLSSMFCYGACRVVHTEKRAVNEVFFFACLFAAPGMLSLVSTDRREHRSSSGEMLQYILLRTPLSYIFSTRGPSRFLLPMRCAEQPAKFTASLAGRGGRQIPVGS